jgi:hypothetical protein
MRRLTDDRLPLPLGWKRSRKGNLWKRLDDGRTATVFARPDGRGFSWCLHDGERPRYDPAAYELECDALDALNVALEHEETC